MQPILRIALLAFSSACLVSSLGAGEGAQGKPMNLDKAIAVIQKSKNPEELEKAALWLCQSKEPGALDVLVTALHDLSFLQRLDSQNNYDYYHSRLRVVRVLIAIGRLSDSKSEEALLKLAADREFTAHYTRVDGIIEASGWLREPSPKILAYLEAKAYPGSTYTGWAIEALARMSSPQACELIEKNVLSTEYDVRSKIGWFTTYLITVRDNLAVVGLYKRVLNSEIRDVKLRNIIVLSLFDYRPTEWYDPDHGGYPSPPSRKDASPEVLRELLSIAELALKLDVPEQTKERVEIARKGIKDILRQKTSPVEDRTKTPE